MFAACATTVLSLSVVCLEQFIQMFSQHVHPRPRTFPVAVRLCLSLSFLFILVLLPFHDRDETKDYWTHVVGFVSKDENLTKAHVRYLESKLIADIARSGKAQLKNSTSPDFAKLPESDVSDMDEFYENIRVLLPLVGLNILQQPGVSDGMADQVTLEMNPVGTNATAVVSGDEIIVQRGSTARLGGVSSWTSYKGLRDQLVAEGKLVPKNDKFYEFSTDVSFTSPSAAAAVVFGGNQNGWIAWKVKGTNLTYKDWKEKELAVSNPEALEDAV